MPRLLLMKLDSLHKKAKQEKQDHHKIAAIVAHFIASMNTARWSLAIDWRDGSTS